MRRIAMSGPRNLAPFAILMLLALSSCSEAVHTQLQGDEAAYRHAADQLASDRASGDANFSDVEAYKLALENLKYDRGSQSDPNGGHAASGGRGHGHR